MAKTIRSLAAVTVTLFVGLVLSLVMMLATAGSARANPGIIYVNQGASGPPYDGLSWTTAFTDVQSALAAAIYGDEIWVAKGVYYPAADASDLTATDPDLIHGDALTITAPILPAWLTLTDHGDGTATLSGTPADADVGHHTVSLQVQDSSGLVAIQEFTITVKKVWWSVFLPIVLKSTP